MTKIYLVIRETMCENILESYKIENVFTNKKKALNYKRYSEAWERNNKNPFYDWKYKIVTTKIDTFDWEKEAIEEEMKTLPY